MATVVVILLIVFGLKNKNTKDVPATGEPIKVGWVSDLTGPAAKWGAIEAAHLAVKEINDAGGINGRPLELIEEDGKCASKDAASAAQKLISIDKVKVILGGHCSPESLAIAPIAEAAKVVMFASMTSSPDLTKAGDYIFRDTQVSTKQSPLVADAAYKMGVKKLGIIYETTSYAKPIVEELKSDFTKLGGSVVLYEGFSPEINDFRSILTKLKNSGAEAVFISPQTQDKSNLIIKQAKDLGIKIRFMGNEVFGSQAGITELGADAEGLIFAVPPFDQTESKAKSFRDKYLSTYKVTELPFGIFTAESYDAVYIIADAIKSVGLDADKIKAYLYTVKDYQGASGPITIDSNGDNTRGYVLKTVKDGQIIDLKI